MWTLTTVVTLRPSRGSTLGTPAVEGDIDERALGVRRFLVRSSLFQRVARQIIVQVHDVIASYQ